MTRSPHTQATEPADDTDLLTWLFVLVVVVPVGLLIGGYRWLREVVTRND